MEGSKVMVSAERDKDMEDEKSGTPRLQTRNGRKLSQPEPLAASTTHQTKLLVDPQIIILSCSHSSLSKWLLQTACRNLRGFARPIRDDNSHLTRFRLAELCDDFKGRRSFLSGSVVPVSSGISTC
uniref:Uncharacterized protein n=1 Tax=Cryptomonas curvata TaxID=233186 RepID=A0A6T8E5L7_9CRYP